MAKITVNLPDEVVAAIEAMAKSKGISKTEALRQAVSLNAFVEKERKEGARLLIERPEGGGVREVVTP
jgi:Arc/MetJ-type ribon-helix-helix transcriptional regulator